jgi:RHS repeat-associated protein
LPRDQDRIRLAADEGERPDRATALASGNPHVHRDFIYDSIGRRIGSDDPDTDDRANPDPATRTWRYLFNRVGDLAAVRDPRGCGQNFFYDLGGRAVGEEYVSCGEAQQVDAEAPLYEVPPDSIGLGPIAGPRPAHVRVFYDAYPDWLSDSGVAPPASASGTRGMATGAADRGQRSAAAFDARGNAIWTARQMAVISPALPGATGALADGRPTFVEATGSVGTVVYDEAPGHTYVRTASYDHADRPLAATLPSDPDWDPLDTASSPTISGRLEYDRRGMPARALMRVGDGPEIPIVSAVEYLRDGLVSRVAYGSLDGRPVVESRTDYDARRRPVGMLTTRTPDVGALPDDLQSVSIVHAQRFEWDAASNLTAQVDERDPSEWPAGLRPQSVEITHDSLYRVVGALYHYSTESSDDADDVASDWRDAAAASNAVDPMRPDPATLVSTASSGNRVRNLVWEWDWLGNMTEWSDDAQQFYERSIGEIQNGQEVDQRPSALYVSSNLDEVGDGGGWLEVDYGAAGNVTSLTVHSECVSGPSMDCRTSGLPEAVALSRNLTCATEQHYEYRWDEQNRIVEARRWDRFAAVPTWSLEARLRYRYDGANGRTVKEAIDVATGDSRIALFIDGDLERRGVSRSATSYEGSTLDTASAMATETQYIVARARLVWDHAPSSGTGAGDLDRHRRLTMSVGDLLGTTAASVDLLSGELLEVSTYYPNGARETLRTAETPVPLEPTGFTTKEADEEVGIVYFGERWLISRIGRWASGDPLHVHRGGGGEPLNSFHYVSGMLLRARDVLGLDGQELASPYRPPSQGSYYGAHPWVPNQNAFVIRGRIGNDVAAAPGNTTGEEVLASALGFAWGAGTTIAGGAVAGAVLGGVAGVVGAPVAAGIGIVVGVGYLVFEGPELYAGWVNSLDTASRPDATLVDHFNAGASMGSIAGLPVAAEAQSATQSVTTRGVRAAADYFSGADILAQGEAAVLETWVTQAHGRLHHTTQLRITTAVGRFADGSYGIASSEPILPAVQRAWA